MTTDYGGVDWRDGSRFWSHLMLEQLLKRGWTIGFMNEHIDNYDMDTWDRQSRPLKRVHHVDLEIQPSVHRHEWGADDYKGGRNDGINMRLFEDGALDLNVENHRTRRNINRVFKHTQHMFKSPTGQVVMDNPLGVTLAYFQSEQQADDPLQLDTQHGIKIETWDITRVDQLVKLVKQAAATASRATRATAQTDTPDL